MLGVRWLRTEETGRKWFFSRDETDLRIERGSDNQAADYVLVIYWPDGRIQTERFSVESQFENQVIEFQKYIEDERRVFSRSPEILPDGWRIAWVPSNYPIHL